MKTKYLRMANRPILALLLRLLWAAAVVLPIFGARADVILTTLHSFTGANDGAYPQAELVQGSEGDLYGTTSSLSDLENTTLTNVVQSIFIFREGVLMV